MAKKDNTHPRLLEIKTLAKQLQSNAKQSGLNLVYGHALDRASAQYGYKDWNTACGVINVEYSDLIRMADEACKKMRGRGETLTGALFFQPDLLNTAEHSKVIEKGLKDFRVGEEVIVGTQSLEDFGLSRKKMFYVKSNPLMSEHQSIIDNPNSEAVPEEYCGSIESINDYVREKGGSLFFPTNSIDDFKNLSDEQKNAIESNVNTKIQFGRTGQIALYDLSTNHDGPFVIGRPGAGQSVYIEDIEGDMQFIKANFDDDTYEGMISSAHMADMKALLESIPDDEITRLVNMPIPIHSAISRGHRAYQNEMIEKTRMIRDEATKRGMEYVISYIDTGISMSHVMSNGKDKKPISTKTFVQGLNDLNQKKGFRK